MNRRSFLTGSLSLTALPLARPPPPAESIRIGYLGPQTGIFAQPGKDMLDGWILRTNFSASQPMHALGDYAAKTLKYRRVAVVAMDNPFGHECSGGFQRVFEDAGGRVVQKIWVPLNALDFAPYLTQLPRDIDAVVQVFVAAQAVRFAKQYSNQRHDERLQLCALGVLTDGAATL